MADIFKNIFLLNVIIFNWNVSLFLRVAYALTSQKSINVERCFLCDWFKQRVDGDLRGYDADVTSL